MTYDVCMMLYLLYIFISLGLVCDNLVLLFI